MISEDIHQAMDDAMSQEKGTLYAGSHWFELVHTALQTNHPELAEKALEHASDITKIGMRGLFRIPSVDIASYSTTSLAEVLSSEGGTRGIALKSLVLQTRKAEGSQYCTPYCTLR